MVNRHRRFAFCTNVLKYKLNLEVTVYFAFFAELDWVHILFAKLIDVCGVVDEARVHGKTTYELLVLVVGEPEEDITAEIKAIIIDMHHHFVVFACLVNYKGWRLPNMPVVLTIHDLQIGLHYTTCVSRDGMNYHFF